MANARRQPRGERVAAGRRTSGKQNGTDRDTAGFAEQLSNYLRGEPDELH